MELIQNYPINQIIQKLISDMLIKFFKEMATIYAKLINQFKNKYQTVFSARFDK